MVMRRAMTGILPVDVQWRRNKSNLAPNFDHGLLAFERERLDEVMLKSPEGIEEFVDVTALREAHCRFVSEQATKDEDVDSLWKAMSLSLWLQRTGLTP